LSESFLVCVAAGCLKFQFVKLVTRNTITRDLLKLNAGPTGNS